jgi:hypothetical protein
MTARSLFICVLLASPAWSQEHSFDLKSESIRNIVRNAAATQFSQVQPRTNTNLPGVPFIYTPPGNIALKN